MSTRKPSRVFATATAFYLRRSLSVALLLLAGLAAAESGAPSLELSRSARTWEFLPVTGMHAGLFGDEAGNLEAWVYPLKILRNFHLNFVLTGRVVPAVSLARTVSVRPESATILYAGDTFQVRETLFVPVNEGGAVIHLEVKTAEPLEIEAVFTRDFQLEWPAALGGTYITWDPKLHAFYLGEEQKKYAALVGSPSGDQSTQEYFTNYSSSSSNSFRLGKTGKGSEVKTIVIAGSTQGLSQAESIYQRLSRDYANLLQQSALHYRDYLGSTVSLELPDAQLQRAYDWARVSMAQGMVTNPEIGTGLIAGYRTSGESQRPGFAWFFGRDSMWTLLALNASGDFTSSRTALEFLAKYQRADGKIAHEISQAADLVPWFTNYPYAYASADATPLFIIAANDYVTHSGDVAFAKAQWDHLWLAYQFLKSTYDASGLPRNFGIGHGWVEGGPLLPVKTELYQAGLAVEALRALANLATLAGKPDVSAGLLKDSEQQKAQVNQIFWAPEKNFFDYAVDTNSKPIDIPSVLSTVPMWFGVLDADKAQATINHLAAWDQQTDWGMRIISSQDPKYDPGGYHFGSVWPLFTGWASVGEYRYHRVHPAYANLRANALLAFDGSLGHVTEVLSGDYYQPLSTSSPHQIWSAAMVVSPLLKGMVGLEVDAVGHRVSFTPHVPADWSAFRVRNVRVGSVTLDLSYRRSADAITLDVRRTGPGECSIDFSPALSLRGKVLGSRLNRRSVDGHLEQNAVDQHIAFHFPVNQGSSTLEIRTRDDFGVSVQSSLPALGSASHGLRVMSEEWDKSHETLTMQLSGVPGNLYELAVWKPGQIGSVEGGKLSQSASGATVIAIDFPAASSTDYVDQKLVIHFGGRR